MEVRDCGRDFFTKEPPGAAGEVLADRLMRGALTPEEALRCAIAVGNLLHRAHTMGRVHGNLSPWSIVVTQGGAALLEPPLVPDPRAAAYRAPEQVRGEPADWRSDIFSYGAVLYELVGGKRAYAGEGAELDQAILERPPAALLSKSPIAAAMEGVIAGCVEKDPARRRQRIQNAVIELKLAGRPHVHLQPAGAKRRMEGSVLESPVWKMGPAKGYTNGLRRRFLVGALAAVALGASAVAAVLIWQQHSAVPAVLKFPVNTPENASYPGTPAISPDGKYLAFSALGPEGKRMLWLRALDEMHARTIPGTEGGFAPFWSPDSRTIGFFADATLKMWKLNLDDSGSPGGGTQVLCNTGDQPAGGAWNRDGTILYSPGLGSGLYRVLASGGNPQDALPLDRDNGFTSYRWPQFLPDGKHFLYFGLSNSSDTTGVYVGSLDLRQTRRLFASETNAIYSSDTSGKSGYLLYVQDRIVMAQPFNAGTLQTEGEAVQFVKDIWAVQSLSLAPLSVSNNAVLVYQNISRPTRQLVWAERSGKQISKAAEPGDWGPPRISPDGKRVAVGKANSDPVHPQTDLWILDEDGSARQLTSESGVSTGSPVWSADGTRVAFWSGPEKDIYVVAASGAGRKEVLLRSEQQKNPTDWSRDGKYVVFGGERSENDFDIWAMSLPDRHTAPIVETIHNENYATVSPDGHWLAYQSDESGQNEVYVQRFEGLSGGTKRRWQISQAGGGLPRWRSDSREMFYLTGTGAVMAASIHPGEDEFAFDPPTVLFQTRPLPRLYNLYDVTADGQRFLLNLPMEWTSSSPITVMTSWTEKLRH